MDQPVSERLTCAALNGVHIVGCFAGDGFTQLVSDNGRVFAMGQNNHSQLGTGDTTNVNTPTEIDPAHFGGAPVAAAVASSTAWATAHAAPLALCTRTTPRRVHSSQM